MKKITTMALLAMVSWALVGTPAQAAENSHHMGSAKHHHKHHHKHKKHNKA
jgi:hypothetical protein